MAAITKAGKMETDDFAGLPPELWLQILFQLSPRDLCSLLLASRQMYKLASHPTLWTDAKVSIDKLQKEGTNKFLKVLRFRYIKKLDMSQWNSDNVQDLNDIFRWISSLKSKLEWLQLPSFQINGKQIMHQVSNEVLGRAVCTLNSIDGLLSCTSGQIRCILTTSIRSKTLSSLNLENIDLTHIPSDVLGRAVSRLCAANLSNTHLTSCQLEIIFTCILSSSTLTDLTLGFVDMSLMSNQLLGQAVSCLSRFHLDTLVRWDQATDIFTACLSSSTLKDVGACFSLLGVSPQLLAPAVQKLERIKFMQLSREQAVAVLNACLTSTTLMDLVLEGVDLSHIAPHILAPAISRLHTVNLANSNLSSSQSSSLLSACSQSTSLKHLNLSHTNLSSIASHLLCEAIPRLETVDLRATGMKDDQCEDLFNAILASSNMEDVIISCVVGGIHIWKQT